jgi:hypothetical protein
MSLCLIGRRRPAWIDNSITTLYKSLIGKNFVIALDCGVLDFALSGNRKIHQWFLERCKARLLRVTVNTRTFDYLPGACFQISPAVFNRSAQMALFKTI